VASCLDFNNMDFFEVVKKRHCCRNFNLKKKVNLRDLKRIIDSGKMAPSAGAFYPTKFRVIRDRKLKEEIAEVSSGGKDFLADAPIVLVIYSDVEKTASYYGERGRNLYVICDASAAAENMFLAATALGLSTCWIGAFDEEKVAKLLNLKENQRPMVIMPIGYPSRI